jgi:hypothetical protein
MEWENLSKDGMGRLSVAPAGFTTRHKRRLSASGEPDFGHGSPRANEPTPTSTIVPVLLRSGERLTLTILKYLSFFNIKIN